jgi:dolichol-phosphate mannosyltransferase
MPGGARLTRAMIVVLLPAFNEEDSLRVLLPKIAAALGDPTDWRVVACNDGSRDHTGALLAEYAAGMPIEVISHPINRGLGETARDLFERAADLCKADDIIVRMDCDDTHEPEVIDAMIARIREGYDVVIASRFQPGGGQVGVNRYRAFVSHAANVFMRIFFSIPGVREYSCGFRAYRAGIVQKAIGYYGNNFIQLKGLGFTGTLEKLVKLSLIGARFSEVPFVLRYDRKRSSSKMVSSITTLGYVIMVLLYYWPWGGWRRAYRRRSAALDAAPDSLR